MQDIKDVKEIKTELEDLLSKLEDITRGDSWAEAYPIGHLRGIINKSNPYDQDLNDLLRNMEGQLDVSSEPIYRSVVDSATEAIAEGVDPDQDVLAYHLAELDPIGNLKNDRDEIYDWVFEACSEAIEDSTKKNDDRLDSPSLEDTTYNHADPSNR
jgi:hypothetical protein